MESDSPITAFTTTTPKPCKITKIADANANAVEEDIISNMLPEPVITHILSFLPTKDAIRTSTLSKKWERRWTSITKLSLHDYQLSVDFTIRFQRMKNFATFVNRALLLNDSLAMDHVSLFLCSLYNWSLLDSWLSNIFKRRVKILQIHSSFQISFSVLAASHSLFNNFLLLEELELLTDSISFINVPMYDEELKLLQNSVNSVDVPAPNKYILFRNLKILNLCGINFNTDSPKSPRNINLELPLLTKFEAKNCAWFVDTSLVMIYAPLLESISIEHSIGVPCKRDKSFICFPDSEDLKEFSFCGFDISQNIIIKSPCHASAKINLYESQHYVSYMSDFHAAALLSQFSHSKSIKFESSKVSILFFSVFNNECLDLEVIYFYNNVAHVGLKFLSLFSTDIYLSLILLL